VPEPADDDLEARVRILEDDLVRLREDVAVSRADAAAARVLASGADRDVSEVRAELRAHTRSLNALRETQLEQGNELAALRREMATEFGHVRREMAVEFRAVRGEMQQGFGTMHTGMAQITVLLRGLADPGPD